jgi:acyl carrier protein
MADTKEELAGQIREIVCEQMGVKPEQVTNEASFLTDLRADELDFIELIMEMEEQFGIAITNEEAEAANTFGKLVDLIYGHVNGRRGNGE